MTMAWLLICFVAISQGSRLKAQTMDEDHVLLQSAPALVDEHRSALEQLKFQDSHGTPPKRKSAQEVAAEIDEDDLPLATLAKRMAAVRLAGQDAAGPPNVRARTKKKAKESSSETNVVETKRSELPPPPPADVTWDKRLSFTAMTFNIRFDFPSDGENRWSNRVDLVAETIVKSGASVVMLQEDFQSQIDDLKVQEGLGKFEFVGRGRNANGRSEKCSIGFHTEVWTLEDNGDFWLSDSPDEPGSNTWGSRHPHKVTWALLMSKSTRKRILFLSTHFDESKGMEDVRQRSARTIINFLQQRDVSRVPVVLGGDFNSDPNEEAAHSVLTSSGLIDTWLEYNDAREWGGTVHFFKGQTFRKRIDWLLHSDEITSAGIEVFRHQRETATAGNLYPSDHHSVVAQLHL